jgi:hypothetical protein
MHRFEGREHSSHQRPIRSKPDMDDTPYLFNARELARLAIYRAAMIARFYNEYPSYSETSRRVEVTFGRYTATTKIVVSDPDGGEIVATSSEAIEKNPNWGSDSLT